MEPDGQFSGHLQLVQCFPPIAGVLVYGIVPRRPQPVKELQYLWLEDAPVAELVDDIYERIAFFDSNACVGGAVFRKQFGELSEFDQSRVSVVEDVAFGESGMAYQHFIMLRQEAEVGRVNLR